MCKEIIEMFIKNGRLQDALGEASRYGDVLAISNLVRQGANVLLPNSSGSPIINIAASGGSLQAIKALLALGADPNQLCDKSGEPVSFAVYGPIMIWKHLWLAVLYLLHLEHQSISGIVRAYW